MAENKLPPLPASDQTSLNRNIFNSFYEIGSKDFWAQNEVTYNEVKEFEKCDHYFEQKGPDAICKKCFFGLSGQFEIRDGKLYHLGEPIGI